MQDDEFNEFYERRKSSGTREINHHDWIGPEEDYRLKVRVNVHYDPMTTKVGKPLYLKDHLKYTYVQMRLGDEWELMESGKPIDFKQDFDPDNRPVRMLVFAVSPNAERYGIAFNAVAPLDTDHIGIMTHKQHKYFKANVAQLEVSDQVLRKVLRTPPEAKQPSPIAKILAFGLIFDILVKRMPRGDFIHDNVEIFCDAASCREWAGGKWK